MNRFLSSTAFAVCALLSAIPARAFSDHSRTTTESLGLGAMLGVPTGLSAIYRFDSVDAVDFGLAFSFDSYFEFYSDYLYHFPHAFGNGSAAAFTPYIGIGAVIFGDTAGQAASRSRYFAGNGSAVDLGARIPLGIEWRPIRPRLGVFGEIVPGVGILPATFGFVEGDLGVRYYF